jgi:hypothetical protein
MSQPNKIDLTCFFGMVLIYFVESARSLFFQLISLSLHSKVEFVWAVFVWFCLLQIYFPQIGKYASLYDPTQILIHLIFLFRDLKQKLNRKQIFLYFGYFYSVRSDPTQTDMTHPDPKKYENSFVQQNLLCKN